MLTSYAQNFEDIILWRALGWAEAGFYIDVGANDPIEGSVSYGFYEQGWQGITVEPLAQFAEMHRKARPRDQLLQCAIDTSTVPIVFWELPGSGLSTGIEAIARDHEAAGRAIVSTTVPCLALASVFELASGRDIHWLKIDVEGMEPRVVESWGTSAARPWVVLVEGTLPGKRELAPRDWESKLVALGYAFAYFDGLNCYYVHERHRDLAPLLAYGPSVFDDAQFSGTSNSPLFTRKTFENLLARFAPQMHKEVRHPLEENISRLEKMHARELQQSTTLKASMRALKALAREERERSDGLVGELAVTDATIDSLRARIAELEARLETASVGRSAPSRVEDSLRGEISRQAAILATSNARIQALQSSTSWRITLPMRAARQAQLALVGVGPLADRIGQYRRNELRRLVQGVEARPGLLSFVRRSLGRAPWIKRHLRSVVVDAFAAEPGIPKLGPGPDGSDPDLSPNASLIARRLKARPSSAGPLR